MTKIIIECVPTHEQMREPYCNDPMALGDWYVDEDGNHRIVVVGDDPFADEPFLVAIHELVENKLCQKAGINQEVVDEWDRNYSGDGEPGEAPGCPYWTQHHQALIVEHMIATWLGILGYDSEGRP